MTVAATPAAPVRLTSLEVASGLVLEANRPRGRLSKHAAPEPRPALEAAVLTALLREPCLVSFSGGRDSSAVLALATSVARREGLSPPIPITNRFPRAEGPQESEWQEQVVDWLGLDEWIKVDVTEELDCVGPTATRVLRRHGLLWPCNAHFHVPLLEAAAGGSLLTGIGGDEALSPSTRARVREVAALRVRPVPRDLLKLGFVGAPRAIRRRLIQRRLPPLWEWLRPQARRDVARWLSAEAAETPVRWRAYYDWLAGTRYLDVGLGNLAVLAADADVQILHPLHDRGFLSALAALPPEQRFATRTEAMQALVGDLLPAALLTRATKATFDEAFWTDHSRELVAAWSGEGVDHDLVDVERLRAHWTSAEPDARSFTLLQAVWLARESKDWTHGQ